MALSKAMAERFKSAKPSKFADEGEPEGDEQARGSGEGDEGEEPSPDSEAGEQEHAGPEGLMGPSDPAEQLADILGVGPEDRDDFAAALKAYIHECFADSMAPEPPGGEMPEAPEEEPGDEAAGV